MDVLARRARASISAMRAAGGKATPGRRDHQLSVETAPQGSNASGRDDRTIHCRVARVVEWRVTFENREYLDAAVDLRDAPLAKVDYTSAGLRVRLP